MYKEHFSIAKIIARYYAVLLLIFLGFALIAYNSGLAAFSVIWLPIVVVVVHLYWFGAAIFKKTSSFRHAAMIIILNNLALAAVLTMFNLRDGLLSFRDNLSVTALLSLFSFIGAGAAKISGKKISNRPVDDPVDGVGGNSDSLRD